MRTINIVIEVTDNEYDLLRMAKSEAPHPDRMRMLLLSEARNTLRRLADDIIRARRQRPATSPAPKAKQPKPVKVPVKVDVLNPSGWLDDDNVEKITGSP